MLTLRLIGPNDYNVHDDGQLVGRIRCADETPPTWLWHITVTIPDPPVRAAATLNKAKARFKAAWEAFKTSAEPKSRSRPLLLNTRGHAIII